MKFKVINLKDEGNQFEVAILREDGERELFSFFKGQGMEQEINGQPAWLFQIIKILKEREEMKNKKVSFPASLKDREFETE